MYDSKYPSVHNYIFQEVNGKINSLQTFYSNELQKFSDGKKTGAAWDDNLQVKWAYFFEINLIICFKQIW